MGIALRPKVWTVFLALWVGASGCGGSGSIDLEGRVSGVDNYTPPAGQQGTAAGAQDSRDQGSAAPRCGDGIVQAGETCDPPSSCLSSASLCPAAPNCSAAVLTGLADQCNATCSVEPITQCKDKDQCCAAGCDALTDSDCFRPELPSQGRGTEEGFALAASCLPEKYDECAA